MVKNTQHVVPNPDGGWSVKKGGSLKATKNFEKKEDALKFGRQVSKSHMSLLYN